MVMPATPEMLYQYLTALNIETRLYAHPPLGTVEESRQLRGDIPGGHCKNLFLRTKKKESWLVVTLEDRQVDLKALARRLGVGAFSFGSPSRLMEHLGVSPGEVTPFALINDRNCRVKVALDQEMLTYHPLNSHPLVNTATLSLSPENLLVFIRACGHEPNMLSL
jgi:Ala-tRNA(Pro) deacylase